MTTKAIMGQPPAYSDELGIVICERLSNGESMRGIAKDPDMPSFSMVARWLLDERYKEFRERYTQARAIQQDYYADEILEIGDDSESDVIIKTDKHGNTYEAPNHDNVNRSRLRCDNRKWLMSRLAPKKYGEKQHIETNITVHHKEVGWDSEAVQPKFVANTAPIPALPPTQTDDP